MYDQIDSNKRNSVLLIIVFVALVVAIGFVVGLFYGNSDSGYPYGTIFVALLISLIMTSISYFSGDKIALAASGAKRIDKSGNSYLYNMVENLCITAGAPMPKVYVIDDMAINAFATGRKPELSSIAVTRGAIEKLENEELEGVIAHELSHVKNYDIRFMMLVAVLVGTISILVDMVLRFNFFGIGRKRDDGEGSNPIFMIIGLVLLIVSPIIAELIKLAISRKREYLADASGSLLTRYPEGLARALEKIAMENRPMARASSATAHLFIANPFGKGKFMSLFSTHPPIEERIKKLRSMA